MTGNAGVDPRPGLVCRYLLKALDAADGQTRRRKRDQAPDRLGLAVKRQLLERAAEADPAPSAFEAWLMQQIVGASDTGATRAMCEQIFLEYRMARLQPEFAAWLAAGAPSDDAERERPARRRGREAGPPEHDHWIGTDDPLIACTCQLPQR